jgi:hypothetical protein
VEGSSTRNRGLLWAVVLLRMTAAVGRKRLRQQCFRMGVRRCEEEGKVLNPQCNKYEVGVVATRARNSVCKKLSVGRQSFQCIVSNLLMSVKFGSDWMACESFRILFLL